MKTGYKIAIVVGVIVILIGLGIGMVNWKKEQNWKKSEIERMENKAQEAFEYSLNSQPQGD